MNKKGHYAGFFFSATIITLANKTGFNIQNEVIILGSTWLGSFIPDIDAEKSYFNYKFGFIRDLYKPIQKLAFKNQTTYNIFKHRGALFHSWVTQFIILILYYITGYYLFLFGLWFAVFVHHILDMTTDRGLRYLYPLQKIIRIF